MKESKWIAWEVQTSRRWSDMEDVLKYINIDFIDYDHKMLVEFALKLNQVLDKSEKEFSLDLIETTKVLLDDLYKYAKDHFEREELFMDLYQLPNIEMHKREHKKILDLLMMSLNDYKAGKVKLTKHLKSQVMDWLINHINIVDYEFFSISNWSNNILNATTWNDVKPIIRLIGINEIDNQHQILTEIALENMRLIRMQSEPERIQKAFKDLIDYALFHFNYEAEFIEKYGIQDTGEHKAQHNHFVEAIKKYALEMKVDFSHFNEMKEWILMWWINHINTTDRLCFDYKNWAFKLMESAETLEDVAVVLRYTGVEFIDEDHIHLMALTLDLSKLIGKQDKAEVTDQAKIKVEILEVLDQIYQYAAGHFEREEKMMVDNNMSDYISHRSEHKGILVKLEQLQDNFGSGRLVLSGNIKTMILEWWIQHTNTTDYRTFVQNNNPINIAAEQGVLAVHQG